MFSSMASKLRLSSQVLPEPDSNHNVANHGRILKSRDLPVVNTLNVEKSVWKDGVCFSAFMVGQCF
jgi:hypothetical protein